MSLKTHAWRWYLVAAALVLAVGGLLPEGGLGRGLIYSGLSLGVPLAILVGVRIHRPASRTFWYLLASGYSLYAVANLVWYPYQAARDRPLSFPSVADALYLSSYALILAAVIVLVKVRTTRDRGDAIDAMILALGGAMLFWTFVGHPMAERVGAPVSEQLVATAYPLIDILLFAGVVRLLFMARSHTGALALLVAAFVAQLTSDIVYDITVLRGTFTFGGRGFLGWLVSYALLGAAALHPSAAKLTMQAPSVGRPPVGRKRRQWAAVLVGVTMAAQGILLALPHTRAHWHLFVLVLAMGAIVGMLGGIRIAGLAVDVDKLRRAEQAVRESQERFRRLSDGTFEGILVVADGRIVEANRAFIQMFGLEAEQVVGLAPDELIAPESLPAVYEHLASGSAEPWEMEIVLRSGRRMWNESRASTIPFGGSEARVISIRDITERKEAEERVRAAEARYRTLVEQLPAFIYVDVPDPDPTSSYRFMSVYASPQVEEMFGYTQEEFVADPETWVRMLHPDDRARQFAEDAHLWSTGEPYRSEYRLITREGRVVWVRNDAVLAQDEAGRPFAQGVMYDITDVKVAEEALRRRDAILEAVAFAAERLLKTGSWEESAQHVLTRLGEATGASRAYVFQNERGDDGGVLMTQTHEWVAPGVSPTIDDPLNARFPYRAGFARWAKELEAGRPIHGIAGDFPEPEREDMESEEVLSLAVVPVFVGDEWWGFIGFDDCSTAREWSEAEIEVLKAASGTLGAAIGRARAEEEVAKLNEELERKVVERTADLEEARAFLDGVISTSPAVIFRVRTQDYSTTYVSPSVERLLGYRPEEIVGVPGWWPEHVHPDDGAAVRAESQRAVEERLPHSETAHRIRCKDGTYRWILSVIRHDYDQAGNRVGLIGAALDITERKQAEEDLRQAKEEAELANRAKSEFLSRASHELRTPLNAILGFGQLLEMSATLPDDRDSLEQIIKAGRHLLGLVDELLDISRIDAGWLSLSIESVAIDEVVHETLDLVLPQGLERDIQLHAETLQPSLHVMADRQRLRQVLLNLLSNAIKYNREGGHVTVSSERIGDESVALRVTDTGPGIPPERIDLLFSPFERLGAETTEQRGIGLGLALTRSLVEAMGGAVGVQSKVGVGSTFSVELHVAQEPASAWRGDAFPRVVGTLGPGWTVLYIEDNFASVKLLERVVSRRPGVKLVAAMQGRLGVELARENRPDLVLLDLHLPDIPGERVLEILKEQPDTADIPVVVMSADAAEGRVRKLLSAGARDYFTKPLELERFLQVLDAILASSTSAERG